MTAIWRREGTRLIVEQKGGWIWLLRVAIGVPLLVFGTIMLWATVTEPVHRFAEGGWSAVIGWLPSTLFSLVFAALTAPMGWWLLFFRGLVIIDPANRQLLEVKDWRLGRKARSHDLAEYRQVAVECDYLLSTQESRSAGNKLANYVRLLPRQRRLASLQVAFFPQQERAKPEELGRLIAELLTLPVSVNLDAIARHRHSEEDAT
jgi:hypothetical protein